MTTAQSTQFHCPSWRTDKVPVSAVAKLERTGEGSVHDAMNVLETLQIKPMVLPPAIVEAALHSL
jgi:hypothetical protein